jgi:DNA polymerase-1
MSEKNGSLSADADNLRAVDDELAAAILDFRSEAKVHSTYVLPYINRTYDSGMNTYKEPFIGYDSRIHANYRQIGAITGRMSCSDPNMQNQPRDDLRLRYNIVADPGCKLVTCDLSNIEMVLFAAYCGEGRLLDAVRAGEDLHVLTAKMLGLKDRRRPGGSIESARQLGKVYNFTTIYGGGLRSIRRYFRVSMDEARLLKARYARAYPEVQRLSNRIEYKLQVQGYVQDAIISGRRFRVDPRDAYKATNYLVQGTAASLLKYAINQLHKDGVPMVALVHDEVVAHCDAKDAEEVRDLIIKRLTYHPGLEGVVPLRADGDIVDRWSQAKDPTFVPQWAQETA